MSLDGIFNFMLRLYAMYVNKTVKYNVFSFEVNNGWGSAYWHSL